MGSGRGFSKTMSGGRWLRLAFFAGLIVASLAAAGGGIAGRATSQAGTSQAGKRPAVPGEIIVGFQPGLSVGQQTAILARAGAGKKRGLKQIHASVAGVPADQVDAVIKELTSTPGVRYAEPNHLLFADTTPNDPSFGALYGLNNTGQNVNGVAGTADADIDAPEAWSVTTGSPNVTVAVIDTGVDFGHPDLAPQQWINTGENCGSTDPTIVCAQRTDGSDNDGDGFVDDYRGWDFVNGDNNPFDDNNHGTHVAGTIGAVGNNGVGVTGINWAVKIMALKFLSGAGSGSTADAVDAIDYAADHGAAVMNNSWGGGGYDQALRDAIAYAHSKNSLFVAAAGNDGVDTDSTAFYPSGYDNPNIVSVAATDNKDNLASFSNWGKTTVDLGAPGVDIYSTKPGNSYQYLSGTSMATPHVAGTAALIKARFPTATDLGIKALLLRSVDPKSSLNGKTTSNGRLNAYNAVSCSSTPKVWIQSPADGFGAGVGDDVPIEVLATNCASPAGVANVSVTVNGSPVSLSAESPDSSLYTGTYTPTAPGSLTISATASVGASTDTGAATGVAAANYTCQAATYSWIDATSGTNIALSGDDVSKSVALAFPFTYYGQSFSSVTVSSNGFLELGSTAGSTEFLNEAIPGSDAPNGIVAAFWDDLVTGTGIYSRLDGVSPNRVQTIEWKDSPHFSNVGAATFEVSLYEGSNDIRLQYQDTDFGDVSYNAGVSATAGVENSSGTLGRQYSFGQSLLTNGTAARCSSGPAAPSGPTITTPSLPNGANGVGYSQPLAATGGTSPYTFTLDSGNLPGGLGLSPGGTISGTPNAPGIFGFVVKVTDSGNPAQSSTKGFSITIASPVAVTTGSLSAGVKGKAYSQTLTASGGTTPYTWSLAAGSLPPGTSLNSTTGTIAGSPTTAGAYGFTVRVTDSSAPSQSATRALNIAVATQLKISTGNLPAGTVAETYSQTLAASGGTAPYAWSIASGALPPGLTLTASTGRISGTPTTVGTFSFTARVTDTGPPVQTVTKNMSIKITVLAVSTTSLPGVTRGQTYSQTLKASGGTTPYSWSIVSGSLPPGLSLASSTGKITGTATTAGTYAFTVKVTDSGSPAQSATKALSIKIS